MSRLSAAPQVSCRRCGVPDACPSVTIGNGLCGECALYSPAERKNEARLRASLAREADRALSRGGGKGRYDLLVCLSGGKDSSYSLYLLKKRFNCRILAFTFDNGFLPAMTRANIAAVTGALGIDHIYCTPRFSVMRRIFRAALKKGGLYPAKTLERSSAVCASCIGLVKFTALKTAIELEIPFIAFGWSPGQAPLGSAFIRIAPPMMRAMEKVVRLPLARVVGARTVQPLFPEERHYRKGPMPYFVHPLALYGYNEKTILRAVKKFGWQRPKGLDPNSSNCLLNALAVEDHRRKYGFNPYALEVAHLVREGHMTRAEGIRRLQRRAPASTIRYAEKKLGVN